MSRFYKYIFLILIELIVSQYPVDAQRQDAILLNQFRLARQYENLGQIEKAAELYLQLYRQNPNSPVFFEGLKRSYQYLQRYSELVEIIQAQLQRNPSNVRLRAELASVYFRNGQEKLAFETWERILKDFPRQPPVYRLVANTMFANRLYDRGIKVYLRARKMLGDENVFATELARLYTLRQSYRKATREYLRFLGQNPTQLKYVERRLASFPAESQVYHDVISEIKKWTHEHPNTLVFRKLLISYYLCYSNYREALREVIELERLGKLTDSKILSGEELFKFAQNCYKEGAYEFAIQALNQILENYPQFPRIGEARVKLANIYLKQNKLKESLACFETIARDYPETRWALQAYLTIGTIALEYFFDLNRAISNFQQVLKQFPHHDERFEALFKLGDCWVAKNNLDQAEKYYRQALNASVRDPKSQTDIRDRARLKLAELEFYRGNFDRARKYLEKIVSPGGELDKPYVNDALELFLLINNQENPEALRLFALAEQRERERKYAKAEKLLRKIIQKYPSTNLTKQALFRLGKIKELQANYSDAISIYRDLVTSDSLGTLGDLALNRIGQIYEQRFQDFAKAKIAYEEVLIKYPDSLLAEEIRKKIRNLEGR